PGPGGRGDNPQPQPAERLEAPGGDPRDARGPVDDGREAPRPLGGGGGPPAPFRGALRGGGGAVLRGRVPRHGPRPRRLPAPRREGRGAGGPPARRRVPAAARGRGPREDAR